MKDTPHQHFGEVDLCYDKLCTRITTSETGAFVLGAIAIGGILAIAAAVLSD
ncbi:MAG: hypothetical protein V4510_03610 [bacterium]